MIAIIVEWFFWLVLTSLTGSLAYGLWKIAESILKRKKKYSWLFISTQLVIIFFAFPIIFLSIYLKTIDWKGGAILDVFSISPLLYEILCVLFWIWLVGFLIEMCLYIIERHGMRKIKKYNLCVPYDIRTLCDEIRVENKIRIQVKVFYNLHCKIPSVSGVFRPVIMLPAEALEGEALKVILTHELTHIKHHDLWWKYVTAWIRRIHWFNPVISVLIRDVFEWKETQCDLDVCSSRKISFEQYFTIVIANAGNKKQRSYLFAMTLSESKNSIKRRMEKMNGYRRDKEWKQWSVVALSILFVCMISLTSYAAGEGILYGYHALVDATEVLETEELIPIEELEEEIIPAGTNSGVIEIELEDVMTYSSGSIDMSIPVNALIKTSSFSCGVDDVISVTVGVTPNNVPTRVGIIEPDGIRRAVTSTGMIIHNFSVRKGGFHQVYVENLSGATIAVSGTYLVY